MPEIRTWGCDVQGCKYVETESIAGIGFKGWCGVGGVEQDIDGTVGAKICPKHKAYILLLLNGELDGVIGEYLIKRRPAPDPDLSTVGQ